MVEWRHQLNGCEFEHTPEDRGKTGKPGEQQSTRSQENQT